MKWIKNVCSAKGVIIICCFSSVCSDWWLNCRQIVEICLLLHSFEIMECFLCCEQKIWKFTSGLPFFFGVRKEEMMLCTCQKVQPNVRLQWMWYFVSYIGSVSVEWIIIIGYFWTLRKASQRKKKKRPLCCDESIIIQFWTTSLNDPWHAMRRLPKLQHCPKFITMMSRYLLFTFL